MIDRNEVLDYIRQSNFVSTQLLCEHFQVSESTIRRVLEKLEENCQITRIHGGAMSVADFGQMTDFQMRNRINKAQKVAIAKKATSLIKKHDTIILMGGTTVCEMCPFIEHMNVTVVTNSILVLNSLRYSTTIQLIILGGLYNYREEESSGLIYNTGLERLKTDFMFMGAAGFDERFGFTITNASADIYEHCMSCSKEVSVLADSSKYRSMQGGATITATPEQVHYLFTDPALDPGAKTALESMGIQIVLSE